MQLANFLLPLSTLAAAVSASPTPAADGNVLTGTGPATLTYTFCVYRRNWLLTQCAAVVTYESPSGKQTVNLGVATRCSSLVKKATTNTNGFNVEGGGFFARHFKGEVSA